MTINLSDFPHDFDVRTDPVFQDRIRPFIESEMGKLAELDKARAAYVRENLPDDYEMNYIFSEHAQRVAEDMRRTCAHLGLPENVQENMYWAMLAHDIGKSTLPADLWDMTDKPEDEIKSLRRSHTQRGLEIVEDELGDLAAHPFVKLMKDVMIHHHEQMDGKGHLGLSGETLSTPVRLACIIESFDGYSIPRYHFGDRDVSVPGVLKRMTEEKGDAIYDMELLNAFAETKLQETIRQPAPSKGPGR